MCARAYTCVSKCGGWQWEDANLGAHLWNVYSGLMQTVTARTEGMVSQANIWREGKGVWENSGLRWIYYAAWAVRLFSDHISLKEALSLCSIESNLTFSFRELGGVYWLVWIVGFHGDEQSLLMTAMIPRQQNTRPEPPPRPLLPLLRMAKNRRLK